MHEYVERAGVALAAAEKAKADRIAALDPLFGKDELEKLQKADTGTMLIEVELDEWKNFLRSHQPPEDSDAAKIHSALVGGAAKAGAAPVVYVQAKDVLAIGEASQKAVPPKKAPKKDEE